MPPSKLKNLAILILLMANLALVALLVPGRLAQQREQASLRQSLTQLCADRGIALDPETIPQDVTLFALELAENPDADLAAAAALLGEDTAQLPGSNRYRRSYGSPLGQCSISRSGSFQAALTAADEDFHSIDRCQQLLRHMGFSVSSLSESLQTQTAVTQLTAAQAVLDVPVFGGGLTLTYEDSTLTAMEGVFFTGTDALTRVSEQSCCSAADAVVEFLSARYELGWVGTRITGMTQGYLRSETAAAAAVRLTPVWRITTDTTAFYVNGLTLEITATD